VSTSSNTTSEEIKAGRRRRCPTHPGVVVKNALSALGATVNQAALAIDMSRAGLGLVINEKSPVTPDTALRLARYLGTGDTGAEHLLGMQMDFDLWNARQRLKGALAAIVPAKRPRRPRD
jgi:addiction module HigA family antidote